MPVRKKRGGKRNARGRGTRKNARRKTTKAKKTPSSIRKNPSSGAHAASVAVMQNPFSKATQRPKIPDGAAIASLSRRVQHVSEFKNKLNEDLIEMVMIPSLGVAAVGHNIDGQNTLTYQVFGFTDQGIGSTFTTRLNNTHGIAEWRLVSQGIHFQLSNTDEENDGWWEACRFKPTIQPSDWLMAPSDGTNSGTPVGKELVLIPGGNFFASGTASILAGNMVEQPGYTTGLLKDIHKHQFRLLNNTTDVNFQQKQKELSYSAAISSTDTTNCNQVLQDVAEFRDLKTHLWCDAYDCVYFKFHCRTNNGTTSNGSKIIMNAIQNVEMVYAPDSDLATYHETNKAHVKYKQILDRLNNSQQVNQAAAVMR